jgi:hypothetical protein
MNKKVFTSVIMSQERNPRLVKIEDYIHSSQKDICQANEKYIMIQGVAGSRKTDTLIRAGLRRHILHGRSLLFLTQVGSVTDEIRARIEAYMGIRIHRQMGSNHYLVRSLGKTIEIANFDAWVHRQLEDCGWPHLIHMGSFHSHKVKALHEMIEKKKRHGRKQRRVEQDEEPVEKKRHGRKQSRAEDLDELIEVFERANVNEKTKD